MSNKKRPELSSFLERQSQTLDEKRSEAVKKRHAVGYRTARENLDDLVDPDSFMEYGQLAVAAQRRRYNYKDLQTRTAADGIITGIGTINRELFGKDKSQAVVIINDYTALAATQGYFHHKKLDRILKVAEDQKLPVIMFTEGGGGRPEDADVETVLAGLRFTSFYAWASLNRQVPRIAVNNGYCFAGSAALFGCADITIATRTSWIGMAGPAMIEGGGLGVFQPTEIGPIEVQEKNGVVDIVVEDEAEGTRVAKQLLSYFQGELKHWHCPDQLKLRDIIPVNRRRGYAIHEVIKILVDENSFIELRKAYGQGIITGFLRLQGKPLGLIANNCRYLSGAINSESSEKAARFLQLCDSFSLPILSLIDTPGFMVGPDSEAEAAVRRMSSLFVSFAAVTVPIVAIILRRGYGLGAMAMSGGSFNTPDYIAAWPTGEFGGMGLEGAVKLGFKKELAAIKDERERQNLFDDLVSKAYERGKATEAASRLEIDAVIEPMETRDIILKAITSAAKTRPS